MYKYKFQEYLHIHRLLIPKSDDRIRLLVHLGLLDLLNLLLSLQRFGQQPHLVFVKGALSAKGALLEVFFFKAMEHTLIDILALVFVLINCHLILFKIVFGILLTVIHEYVNRELVLQHHVLFFQGRDLPHFVFHLFLILLN